MLIFTCDHSEPRVSCYVFMISGLLIRKSGALLLHTLAVKWISLAWPENSQEALRNARIHFLIHTQLRADKEMWCRYFCHWSKIEVKQSLMSFFSNVERTLEARRRTSQLPCACCHPTTTQRRPLRSRAPALPFITLTGGLWLSTGLFSHP